MWKFVPRLRGCDGDERKKIAKSTVVLFPPFSLAPSGWLTGKDLQATGVSSLHFPTAFLSQGCGGKVAFHTETNAPR